MGKRPNFFLSQQDPNLLDNFLDEVIGFQKDRSQEVRKFLIGFIEEACKKDPEVLPKVITNLQIFMADDGLAIRKRVIQVFANFQFFLSLIGLMNDLLNRNRNHTQNTNQLLRCDKPGSIKCRLKLL